MHSIAEDLRSFGDVAATHELYSRGRTQADVRDAVQRGTIVRVRKGWFCLPDLAPELVRAWRVGGKLTGASAARHYGLWVPGPDGPLEVEVAPNACQLRSRSDSRKRMSDLSEPGVVVHWVPTAPSRSRVLVDLDLCISQIAYSYPAEFAFVVAESALNQKLMTSLEWNRLLTSCPRHRRRALVAAGKLSQSGTESMFSFRMQKLGIRFRQQVWIGHDRVDFLIGETLVIEIDSKLHDRIADNARDTRLGILGYRVLRFDYQLIVHHWGDVRAAVLAALLRGDHQVA
ncbi:MAG: DUF559 domain-containing protein [Terrimesophilobacter sp.]